MTAHLFAIHIVHKASSPDLAEYVSKLNRVREGVYDLFESIGLAGQLMLRRRIDALGDEWIDVDLTSDQQMNLFDALETSLGIPLTQLEQDHELALDHARQALQLLNELRARRSWPASHLIHKLERRQNLAHLSKVACDLDSGDGSIRFRFADGQTNVAELPNRRFSALWSDPVDLKFCPRMAGPDGAIVYLTKEDGMRIGARSREIQASWANPFVDNFSIRLQSAANTHSWVLGKCLVVTNAAGTPKGLLLQRLEVFTPNAATSTHVR